MSEDPKEFLTRDEVSHLLQVSYMKLYNWEKQGKGPPVVRPAPRVVLYRRVDIEKFLKERSAASPRSEDLLAADRERVVALHLATPVGFEAARDRAIFDGTSLEAFRALIAKGEPR